MFSKMAIAQPYIDIANFNYQTFSAPYKQNETIKNNTDNFNLNLFFPKEFKNGNALLLRFNSEILKSFQKIIHLQFQIMHCL